MSRYKRRAYKNIRKAAYKLEDDPYLFHTIDFPDEEKKAIIKECFKDEIMDRYMRRSVWKVLKSYSFRRKKGLHSEKIYSYSGDSEAHRLLNRSVVEAIKESMSKSKTG